MSTCTNNDIVSIRIVGLVPDSTAVVNYGKP